jgi:hypothetical protein
VFDELGIRGPESTRSATVEWEFVTGEEGTRCRHQSRRLRRCRRGLVCSRR